MVQSGHYLVAIQIVDRRQCNEHYVVSSSDHENDFTDKKKKEYRFSLVFELDLPFVSIMKYQFGFILDHMYCNF